MSTTSVQQTGFEDEGDMVKNKGEGVMKCVEEKEKGEVGGVKKSKGKSKNPSQPPARYILFILIRGGYFPILPAFGKTLNLGTMDEYIFF